MLIKYFEKVDDRICGGEIFALTLQPVSRSLHRMSKVAVIMGSASDWDVMSPACATLEAF